MAKLSASKTSKPKNLNLLKGPRFSDKTLAFLLKATRQKRADWLDRNRDEYERVVREPLHHLARSLKAMVGPHAPGYNFPQKGLGRLKRSAIRAQEYGSLYRDYLSYQATTPAASRFDHNPNLYFLINPTDKDDQVLVAGGLYVPSSRQVRSLREAIAADASAFDRLFASKDFSSRFPGGFSKEKSSSRVPRGFDPEHPRMEWIKLQAFFVWRSYTKKEFYSSSFPELVASDWKQILRLNALLDLALQGRLAMAEPPAPLRRSSSLSDKLEGIETFRRNMDF